MQGPWIQSLVSELRSCLPHGPETKKRETHVTQTYTHTNGVPWTTGPQPLCLGCFPALMSYHLSVRLTIFLFDPCPSAVLLLFLSEYSELVLPFRRESYEQMAFQVSPAQIGSLTKSPCRQLYTNITILFCLECSPTSSSGQLLLERVS